MPPRGEGTGLWLQILSNYEFHSFIRLTRRIFLSFFMTGSIYSRFGRILADWQLQKVPAYPVCVTLSLPQSYIHHVTLLPTSFRLLTRQ